MTRIVVKRARKAIESLYDGFCTVYGYKNITDEETGLDRQEKEILHEKLPCHLSYETVTAAKEGSGTAKIAQAVKLFCAPEPLIEPGSFLVVEQEGRKECYEKSGKGAIYFTHQEIPLSLSDKYP